MYPGGADRVPSVLLYGTIYLTIQWEVTHDFSEKITRSPVAQSFIWVAEYADGSHLAEYNFDNRKANSFYHIDKTKLIRFGLIGKARKSTSM